MNPFKIVLISLFALGVLFAPVGVGEPRKPTTPTLAIVSAVANMIMIYGVLYWL